MIITRLFTTRRFLAPAGEADGNADRGDDFDADAVATAAAEKAEAERVEKEEKAAAAKLKADAAGKTEEDLDEDDEGKDGDGKTPRKDSRIPLARHKELLRKERDERQKVENELAKYQGGAKVADTNEQITAAEKAVIKLEESYNQLMTDGKTAEATKIMGEIRGLERDMADAKAEMRSAAAEARAVEKVRYETTLERMEAAYPVLDEKHDDFDEAKSAEVIELMTAFRRNGMTPAAALQKAVKYALGEPTTKKQEAAVDTKAKVDKDDVAKAVREERKKEAVKKNADAAEKQPPDMTKTGADSDKAGGRLDGKTIVTLKYSDFIKVDEATLARARGDEL